MKTTVINSPLGFIKIEGNDDGIFFLNFTDSISESTEVPLELQDAVTQLQEYFAGIRKDFTIKISPKERNFSKKFGNCFNKYHTEKPSVTLNFLMSMAIQKQYAL